MEYFENLFDTPNIDGNTNFWMIRTKQGFFFDEFLKEQYIGIGWNAILKSMLSKNQTHAQGSLLKSFIKETYNESKPGTALNKCVRFCYELKEDDIAVIVGNNRIAFAYVGEYFENNASELTSEFEKNIHKLIAKANPDAIQFCCPYVKRRKIKLIKVLDVDDTMSPYLQSAIARNRHSLSELNEYAELILSACFDTYVYREKLTVTFRVRTKNEINVLDLSNFVLCTAKLLSDDHPENVHLRTTLHSPGDIILQVWDFAQENSLLLLMCYMAIFGGKVGNYEFNSIIGVIKSAINADYEKKKQDIELKRLSAEADLAEEQALEKQLENIKTMKELQLSSFKSCAQPLADAAKNLEILPSSGTVIDLRKVFEAHKNK